MNSFSPLAPQEELSTFDGFKQHLWLAFREFDINYYETYVFTLVIGGTIIWAIVSLLQKLFSWRKDKSGENRALTLLRDDLQKAGPYKRDRSGMPVQDAIIKIHAVVFKHAQKKIIEKELAYQKKRIKYITENDMAAYKNVVRRSNTEYQ